MSDQHLVSPYNVTPESHIKVTRVKEMITNLRPLDCERGFQTKALVVALISGDNLKIKIILVNALRNI